MSTAYPSRSWLRRLIIAAVSRAFRRLQNVPAIMYIAFVLLATSEHVSAQGDFESLSKTCAYKKAYAVVIKLLAVYASHVVTITVEPGLDLWMTVRCYLAAALLPSATALVAFRDLFYCRSGFKQLPVGENEEITGYYKNMQKAINAGSVFIRAKRNLVLSGWEIEKSRKIRGRPLSKDEVFLIVPRGTPAGLFEPTIIEGNSQLLQVFVGAIQLGLATMQLYSASSPRIKAYGCGAFIYTIIPYAIGSAVNVICGIFIKGYPDLTEMVLKSEISSGEPPESSGNPGSDHLIALKSEIHDGLEWWCIFFQMSLYLGILGGMTRFRPGISTSAQRGWFISWALVGMLYGALSARRYDKISQQAVEIAAAPPEISTWTLRDSFSQPVLGALMVGAATIGGVVAMIQQYLHFIEC